jgi:hypothetical protein
MDVARWSAVLVVVLGVAAAIAYHLVLTATWRYGLAHCRLTNHHAEGLKTGRSDVLQRTTSHEALLGGLFTAPTANRWVTLTSYECLCRGILSADPFRVNPKIAKLVTLSG